MKPLVMMFAHVTDEASVQLVVEMNVAITYGEARIEDFTLQQRTEEGSWGRSLPLSVEQSTAEVNPGTVSFTMREPLLVGQRVEVEYACSDEARVLGDTRLLAPQ